MKTRYKKTHPNLHKESKQKQKPLKNPVIVSCGDCGFSRDTVYRSFGEHLQRRHEKTCNHDVALFIPVNSF